VSERGFGSDERTKWIELTDQANLVQPTRMFMDLRPIGVMKLYGGKKFVVEFFFDLRLTFPYVYISRPY
jgi:hypothetical protein